MLRLSCVSLWNDLLVRLGARPGAAPAPWARAASDPPSGGDGGGPAGPAGPPSGDGAPAPPRPPRRPEPQPDDEDSRQRARRRPPDPRGGRRAPQIPVGPAQKPMRTVALWLFILLVAVIGAQMYLGQRTTPVDLSPHIKVDVARLTLE